MIAHRFSTRMGSVWLKASSMRSAAPRRRHSMRRSKKSGQCPKPAEPMMRSWRPRASRVTICTAARASVFSTSAASASRIVGSEPCDARFAAARAMAATRRCRCRSPASCVCPSVTSAMTGGYRRSPSSRNFAPVGTGRRRSPGARGLRVPSRLLLLSPRTPSHRMADRWPPIRPAIRHLPLGSAGRVVAATGRL